MKRWAKVIEQHVTDWTARCGQLNVKWWPKFAYHFTDVRNAARVLTDGHLLSRERAVVDDRMLNDHAAADVIAETPEAHQRFARLYFRPRTPTQYRTEGIRSPRQLYHQAHCPVPIFFCFDLAKLLMQDEILFSNGSMGRPEVRFGGSLELFESIPFELVYHDRSIASHEEKSKIIFHRHAEILVPDRLSLEHLAGVACRTDAERRTLLHLLPAAVRKAWQGRIHRVGDPLFYRAWPHVDSVSSVDQVIRIRFHAMPVVTPVPVAFRARNLQTGRVWSWDGHHADSSELAIELRDEAYGQFEVSVQLHGCLAFRGLISVQDDFPF